MKFVFANNCKIRSPRFGCQIPPPTSIVPININNTIFCSTNGTYDKLYPCFIINENKTTIRLNGLPIQSIPVIPTISTETEYVGGIRGSGDELEKKEYPVFRYLPVVPMSPENLQLISGNLGFSICTPDLQAYMKFAIPIDDNDDLEKLKLNYFYRYHDRTDIGQLQIRNNRRTLVSIPIGNIFTGHIYKFSTASYEFVQEGRTFDPFERDVACWNIALV